ncbi:transposase (plasmid) [Streptomyces goshikiensis]|nr:transposase [Streptomyces goshikiensis]
MKERQRRLAGVDERVLSLSAKVLTHGEISAHLAEVYGAEFSEQTIFTITDPVMEGVAAGRAARSTAPIRSCSSTAIRDGQVANRRPRAVGRWRGRRECQALAPGSG